VSFRRDSRRRSSRPRVEPSLNARSGGVTTGQLKPCPAGTRAGRRTQCPPDQRARPRWPPARRSGRSLDTYGTTGATVESAPSRCRNMIRQELLDDLADRWMTATVEGLGALWGGGAVVSPEVGHASRSPSWRCRLGNLTWPIPTMTPSTLGSGRSAPACSPCPPSRSVARSARRARPWRTCGAGATPEGPPTVVLASALGSFAVNEGGGDLRAWFEATAVLASIDELTRRTDAGQSRATSLEEAGRRGAHCVAGEPSSSQQVCRY
jgi:hypothetical protein